MNIDKRKVVISKKPCSGCGSTMWHYKGQKFPLKQFRCVMCAKNPPFQKEVKKGWIVVSPIGNIVHENTYPMIYIQKTKPRVMREGLELVVIPCEITYSLQKYKRDEN